MTYPIPEELSTHIDSILVDIPLTTSDKRLIYNRVVQLFIRENRKMRHEVAHFMRSCREVSTHLDNYNEICAAAAGEETCRYILNNIVKPQVYSEDTIRKKAVEDFIRRFNQDGFE